MRWFRSYERLVLSTVAISVVLAGCGGPKEHVQGAPTQSANVTAPVATVRQVNAPRGVEAPGIVKAQFTAALSAKVIGRVQRVAVNDGDSVRRGQTLVTLDARDLSAAVDLARANVSSASAGFQRAQTAATMEVKLSEARVKQAEAQLAQARAAAANAKSRLDLALAGPRTQERVQAQLAVQDAQSGLRLAQSDVARMKSLYQQGAIPKRDLEVAENAYQSASARYDSAVQALKIAQEGTRAEDLQSAREALREAEAAIRQAEAGLLEANASKSQVQLRRDETSSARAQIAQSEAARHMASVNQSFASLQAPFDGRVTARMADPGALASPGTPLIIVEGGPLRLEATVSESLLPFCTVGTKVSVRIDALGDSTLTGTVVEVVPKGDAETHSFVVKIRIQGDTQTKSGMFGRAIIATKLRPMLLAPASAVWVRDGLHYVYALNSEGIAHLRLVTVGQQVGEEIEVLSGLSEGDRVVANGRETATDGAKVTESTGAAR